VNQLVDQLIALLCVAVIIACLCGLALLYHGP
jgi:hypothetical protein